MAGIFDKDALKGLSCSGRRPWLTDEQQECSQTPRVLQRGASNLYFPVTYSALSIPPWTGQVFAELESQWATLRRKSEDSRNEDIEAYADAYAGRHGLSREQYIKHVQRLLDMEQQLEAEDIRPQEYQVLAKADEQSDASFQTLRVPVPFDLDEHFDSAVRVRRLREVRALLGFKRIHPHVDINDPGQGKFGEIYDTQGVVDWLPAIEVHGEGIFLELSISKINSWLESNPEVSKRVDTLNADFRDFLERLTGTEPEATIVTPTEVLVHSLAHALIKRLAFEAGYDAASLRERLYVSEEMAGLLIYTSTPDADGTLGGLERQGATDKLQKLIRGALEDIKWCASDPLCQRGISSTSEELNLSACHNCLFLPETSCEKQNRLLDRALLIGDPTVGITGFFEDVIDEDY